MREEFNNDAFGDDDNNRGVEEIIDEEELMLLKEMKDLKKSYRENYDKLKNIKVDINDIQNTIDNTK
jgi:deoxyadenosine/deoxycytidine kinase